ncbi:LexA family transcriptional regulator [Sulfurivirga sp.]|uniref:LexA family protein n=1 Tax=Sulfurivirga sp. TaxID=2614236 RepID=UPI0025DEAED0|nr:XRE family transcriptional regulator [Sulfurivirga sp.]
MDTQTPKTIGERIKQRRQELGYTQRKLAELIGIKPPSLHGLESGRAKSPSAKTLHALVRVLKTTPDWILEGKGPKEIPESGISDTIDTGSAIAIATMPKVPIISFVQAGNWSEVILDSSGELEYAPCPVPCGPHTFGLHVEGESMLPRFHPGDLIFVDPDRGYGSGDFVIAQIDHENKATFKQYLETEDGPMLKALNPDWPNRYLPLPEGSRIIGRVIAKLEAL